MKALICTLNSKYIHSSLAPWCLFASCKEYCNNISLSVVEGTVNEKTDALFQKLLTEAADVISFSVYIWNKTKTLELCRKIKEESPNTIIILGGPEVAYNQKELLNNSPFIDYILSGEGEITLPKLLECIEKGLLPKNIDGISYRNNGELIIKNEIIGEHFDYPSPYTEEYLKALGGRIAYIETSRGCPFNCAYCLSGRCGKVKFKSMEQTKKEILLLAASGTKTVKFVDRTFNCNNSRAIEILRFINENYGKAIPHGVCFHFEISADILKDSFIQEVSRAEKGAFQFEIGIQSLNTATLEAIGRKSDTEKLFANIKKLISLRNCHIHTDLIAGLPHETLQSFTSGFNSCYTLGADMLQLGFLKLLHGSPLRDNSELYPCSFSSEPPYEVISTSSLSEHELDILRIAEKEVDRLHNSGRFRRTLSYAFESTSHSPLELFIFLGKRLPEGSTPLDKLTNELHNALCTLNGINHSVLRDRMIFDRIATNSSGIIPKSLLIEDKRLKKVKHTLSLQYPCAKGTNRCTAILYSEKKVIFCDYEKKDPVTGEYDVKALDFDFFGETFFDFNIDK